jgi:(2R)-3-sulfolactate dehydrogenase (NADP+)
MKLSLPRLHDLLRRGLCRAGVSPANASVVAAALAAAEADGIPSHGASRLAAYAEQVKAGKVRGKAVARVSIPAPGAVLVDAGYGFAYPAMQTGLACALQRLPRQGVVALAIRHSHHAGVLAQVLEQAALEGYAGIGFCNAPAAIAPWGGRQAMFGTNPIAFACPRRQQAPLIIDLSLSKVARGKVMLAKQRGESIPPDWALDQAGQPTTDADAALAGSMLPIGDAKGAQLALIVEILCAGLTGSQFGFQASSLFDAHGGPPDLGQFFLLFNPAAFSPHFTDSLETLLAAMLAQPGVRLPGERRLRHRAQAQANGVELGAALYQELRRYAGD